VTEDECPLLVVRSGEGLVWASLKEFAKGVEFIEAPFELAYALFPSGGDMPGFGNSSGLDGWEGETALFPSRSGYIDSRRFPWLRGAVRSGNHVLARLGWSPVGIRLVRPAAKEKVPLVCRVWRNSGRRSDHGRETEQGQRVESWAALKRLYGEAPEVVLFPKSIAECAAIGSVYWNIDHPKIVKIVAVLTALGDRLRQRGLSAEGMRAVRYLASHSFYGYVVPSRMSGRSLALEVPNWLLDVAEEEGLGHAERLVVGDFFPGTVEGYQFPHNHDLGEWRERGTGLGQRLDVTG